MPINKISMIIILKKTLKSSPFGLFRKGNLEV